MQPDRQQRFPAHYLSDYCPYCGSALARREATTAEYVCGTAFYSIPNRGAWCRLTSFAKPLRRRLRHG